MGFGGAVRVWRRGVDRDFYKNAFRISEGHGFNTTASWSSLHTAVEKEQNFFSCKDGCNTAPACLNFQELCLSSRKIWKGLAKVCRYVGMRMSLGH